MLNKNIRFLFGAASLDSSHLHQRVQQMNTWFVLNLHWLKLSPCYSDVEVDSRCGQPTVMLGVVRL